jgi:hypothetical protein
MVAVVLGETVSKVKDQFHATIGKDSFSIYRAGAIYTFESPKALDKAIKGWSWLELFIAHYGATV